MACDGSDPVNVSERGTASYASEQEGSQESCEFRWGYPNARSHKRGFGTTEEQCHRHSRMASIELGLKGDAPKRC